MVEARIENATKRFGEVVAVDNVTATFLDKKLTVVVGPSGCGKSTVLRMIAGLEIPTKGVVFIGDQDVSEVPPWDRNIAMVFQSYALYPHMTVFDNMAFPLKAKKTPKDELRRRVKEAAEMLGIEMLFDRKPKELSGGQMQRVALGRAIVREPDVFLMDEPLSNLDAKLRVYMRAELKRFQKELGITTVYVTHDQAEAMTMGDNLFVMNEGRVLQIGSPEDVYNHPNNMFVAGFVGSPPMNFIEGTLDRGKGLCVCDAFEYKLPSRVMNELKGKEISPRVMLGVRPEDIEVSKSEKSDFVCKMKIYMTEILGKEVLATLKVRETILKAMVTTDLELELEDTVWVQFNENAIHLFDTKTEEAIV